MTSTVLFDVSEGAALGETARIAGSLYLPEPPNAARAIALLVPGGGFTRAYFDLQVDGYDGYSAARQLAVRGFVVVAVDNLGTGESTVPADGNVVTLDRSAAALAEVARQLRGRAACGELHASLSPRAFSLAGIGHSLGGCLMTLVQGEFGCCDALGVLGYSCRYIVGAVDPETGERLRKREYTSDGYNRTTPSTQRERFYSSATPMAIVAAEEGARAAMPNGVAEALVPGRTAAAAAKIDVPVLLGFGDHDVSPDPHAEPAYYRSSDDVTLLILKDSGHAHNSAPGRVEFWDRIVGWMEAALRLGAHPSHVSVDSAAEAPSRR